MQWVITNGFFQPSRLRFKNEVWRQVTAQVYPLQDFFMQREASLYLRGSALEQEHPHPLADIDFMLIAPQQHWIDIQFHLRTHTDFAHRPVDLVLLRPEGLENNPVMRLLLHTRSELLVGVPRTFLPVPANFDTAKAHWDIFQIKLLPNEITTNRETNACMVKQLIRSIGPIELLKNQRFSRHLPTCVKWVENVAPAQIIPCFQQAWYHIGAVQHPPVQIQLARDWLLQEWKKMEKQHHVANRL